MQHISVEPPAFFHRGPSPLSRLALLGLLSIALLFADTRFRYLEGVRQVVAVALYPFQRAVLLPGEAIAYVADYFTSKRQLADENARLKEQLVTQSPAASSAALLEAENVRSLHLCLSHLHLDHLQGLGFFAPMFNPDVEVHIWGPRSTVRMAPTAPGDVAEMDFGKLGTLINPITGKRQVVYGLLVVLVYSRHAFLWPLVQQTVEATIEGLEQAWRFFGGLPVRLVLDNFPAAVAGPDALNPRPTRAFLEYSQARGLLLDPARVRHPKDKPHVESGVRYARERWWKGGRFVDLADSREQAESWCRDVAGLRVHGTTRRLPRVVFEDPLHGKLGQGWTTTCRCGAR